MAGKAGCDTLAKDLDNSLVTSFRKSPSVAVSGKEALPFPMAVTASFERRIRAPGTPNWETIVLGGMCVMLWGGLRWADVQRTSPNTLVVDGQTIRATAWRTKTSTSG